MSRSKAYFKVILAKDISSQVFGCEESIFEVNLLIQGHCQGQKQRSFSRSKGDFKVILPKHSFFFQKLHDTDVEGLLILNPWNL